MELRHASPFHPVPWAKGPHAQTILSHLWKSPFAHLPWVQENLDLEPSETLRLEVLTGNTNTVVVLFHGLGGHSGSSYMHRNALLAANRGHSIIAVNHRGSGLGRGMAHKPYNCGSTGDVAAVIAHARRRFPGKRIVTVGFSLSAAMLVLLLGRDQHLEQPDAAIAINPPGDLEACSQRLIRGLNRLYDRRFLNLLRDHVQGRADAPILPPMRTLRDFDAAYTAPQAGYADRADYYAQCSCGDYLAHIQTPLVLLTSEDDPFAPASDLGPASPTVLRHQERHGGHCGYLSAKNTPLGTRRWMDYAVDHYLAQLS